MGRIKSTSSFEGDLAEIIGAFAGAANILGRIILDATREENEHAYRMALLNTRPLSPAEADDPYEDIEEEDLEDDSEDIEEDSEDIEEDSEEYSESFSPPAFMAPTTARPNPTSGPQDPTLPSEGAFPNPLANLPNPAKDATTQEHPAMHSLLGQIQTEESVMAQVDMTTIPLEPEAWENFSTFLTAWLTNFDSPVDKQGNPTEEQPDRIQLMKELGQGRWPIYILRWVLQRGGLQLTILHYLAENEIEAPQGETALDYADRIAMNITQVAHVGFPDLADLYDHSTRWRRSL